MQYTECCLPSPIASGASTLACVSKLNHFRLNVLAFRIHHKGEALSSLGSSVTAAVGQVFNISFRQEKEKCVMLIRRGG